MKIICLLLCTFFLINSCSTTKLNSYGKIGTKKYQKIKTQGELVHLKIEEIDLEVETTSFSSQAGLESFSSSELIIEQLLKIPDYLGKIIKDRKKKYTQNYKSRNTLSFKTGGFQKNKKFFMKLPKIQLTRKIFTSSKQTNNKTALMVEFSPKIIDDSLFTFQLTNLKSLFTKAKTSAKYPVINLLIEIKGIYIDTDEGKHEEKEYTSKNIILPFSNTMNYEEIYKDLKIYSDPFKIEGLKMIEVAITEINPYHLKLEEMQSNLTENTDDLSTILTKLTELIKTKK